MFETRDLAHNLKRFRAFEELASCQLSCLGGECNLHTTKLACGINQLQQPCVVYSVGGNNEWEFEQDMLRKTECEIHTFDCTGTKSRFVVPKHPKLHFHYICVHTHHMAASGDNGEFWTFGEIARFLNHTRVDLLKMDVEGFEWPLFLSWADLDHSRASESLLPMQILVEVHYQTQMSDLARDEFKSFKFPTDMVRLQSHFLRLGYSVVKRRTHICLHCVELTLLRIRCL